jgi:anti-sigma factor RsiW
MNCQEFWNRLSKPPGAEADLEPEHETHLAECPACRAHMARQQELAAGLRRMAESFSGTRAPARVETRLLRAFHAQNGRPAREHRSRWLLPLCWSAAAAVVLALALMLSGIHQPAPQHSTPAVADAPVSADSDVLAQDDGFIPLPNAEGVGPNEAVNMVRMEVPRSAMLELGFSVSPDRVSDRVEADVLLGSDGLARAVRFLE